MQPIAEIAADRPRGRRRRCTSDGVQALGKIPVDVQALGVDLYTISGHKLYAPEGRRRALRAQGHARSRRSPSAGITSATAAPARRMSPASRPSAPPRNSPARASAEDSERLAALRDRLENAVLDRIPGTGVNGSRWNRAPNTTNLYFDGIDGEALVIALDLRGFAVSTGAACSSGAVEPSHVLPAIGLARDRARASMRFSLGRSNTAEQVDALIDAHRRLRRAPAQDLRCMPEHAHRRRHERRRRQLHRRRACWRARAAPSSA